MNKNKDSITFDYIDGHFSKNGILTPMFKSKAIKMTNTKRFHNCLYIILGLSKCQRLLMDWLSEEMDIDNMITHDEYLRAKFIKFISSIQVEGKVLKYEDQTVANAFNGIVKSNDLLLKKAKGKYMVNPEYYWRGKDEDRIATIMMNIEFGSENTNFKIVPNGTDYALVKKSMLKMK